MKRFKQVASCRATVVAVLFVAVVLFTNQATADPMTYSFVNYPDGQGGYTTLSGTITTDGTLGTINSSNILSITISLTLSPNYPSIGYPIAGTTYTATNPPTSSGDNIESLVATTTSLSLPFGNLFGINSYPTGAVGPWVYWVSGAVYGSSPGPLNPYGENQDVYEAGVKPSADSGDANVLWNDIWATGSVPWVEPGCTVGPQEWGDGQPVTIATAVPEPSTLVLLGIGAVSLLAYAWRRRRRTAATSLSEIHKEHVMFSSTHHCRFVVVAAHLLFAAVLAASSARADTIVYDFVDHPDLEAGYSLSGTITTDGATGSLIASDIESWGFTISRDGVPQYTDTIATPGSSFTLNGSNLVASTAQLLFYNQVAGAGGLVFWPPSGNPAPLCYINSTLDGIPAINLQGADPLIPFGLDWFTYTTTIPVGDALVIATAVPEPASLTLLVSALLGLVGAFYLRRRRAKA